jgi:hypothetical protein
MKNVRVSMTLEIRRRKYSDRIYRIYEMRNQFKRRQIETSY